MDNHDTIYVMAEEIAGSLSEPKKNGRQFFYSAFNGTFC